MAEIIHIEVEKVLCEVCKVKAVSMKQVNEFWHYYMDENNVR